MSFRDLQAVERELRLWGRSGRLKPKAVNNLLAHVERYRQELLHPVVAEVVAPAAAKPQAAGCSTSSCRRSRKRLCVPQVVAKPQAVVVPQATAKQRQSRNRSA